MKIAIFLVGRIGDMILSTPMYSAIKKKYPDALITVIAGKSNYNILSNNPYIEKVWVFDKNPFKLVPLVFKIMLAKFDYWLDPKDHYSSESALMSRFCKAKYTVGYNRPTHHNFDFEIPTDKDNARLHYSQRCYNALIPLGINVPKIIPRPELYETPNEHKAIDEYILTNKINTLINLSAGAVNRIYPADKWIVFISSLDMTKNNIILSYTDEQADIAKLITENFCNIKCSNSYSIWELISLIKRVDYVISPDTSAIHIASAFNKPLIGLYNDYQENYCRFKPSTDKYKIIMPKGSTNVSIIDAKQIIDAFDKLVTE
jgi:ADP-heptose:LPS heptosyltransferase